MLDDDDEETPPSNSPLFKSKEVAKLPINEGDFKEMVTRTKIFVDKSMILNLFLSCSRYKFLIPRPRRTGKSLNISMVQYFCNMVVDQKGKPLQPQPYRVLFEGGKLKDGVNERQIRRLKIADYVDSQTGTKFIDLHQGQYPVIYMNWKEGKGGQKGKDSIKVQSYLHFKRFMEVQISNLFVKYSYLLPHLKQQKHKDKFYLFKESKASLEELQESLHFLVERLYQFHKRKIVVLIDQYDAAYNQLLQSNNSDRRQIANFISNMLQYVVKDKPHLQLSIFTGIFDILIKKHSGLNNITYDNILSPGFNEFYGLSEAEIRKQLIQQIIIDKKDPRKKVLMNHIKRWYNGYIAPNSMGNTIKIFNSFSVISYLDTCIYQSRIVQPQAFWIKSGTLQALNKMFETASKQQFLEKILQLLSTNYQEELSSGVAFKYEKDVNMYNLANLIQVPEQFFTLVLISTGYITGAIITVQQKKHTFSKTQTYLRAVIPNLEVRNFFQKQYDEWYKSKLLLQTNDLAINLFNHENIKKNFSQIYNRWKQTIGTLNESTLTNIFWVGYLNSKEPTHIIDSEISTGYGRTYHIFTPMENQDETGTVFIHEYKHENNSQKQSNLCIEALWQIYEKNYMNRPLKSATHHSDIKKFLLRGIVFIEDRSAKKCFLQISEDHIHSIAEAQVISNFFQQNSVKTSEGKDRPLNEIHAINQLLIRVKLLFMCRQKERKGGMLEVIKQIKEQADNKGEKTEFKGFKNQVEMKKIEKSRSTIETSSLMCPNNFDYDHVGERLPRYIKWLREEHHPLTQQFKQAFPDGESLYNCTEQLLKKVPGIGQARSRSIFLKIQELKKEEECFRKR